MRNFILFVLYFFVILIAKAQITYDRPFYSSSTISAGLDSNICSNSCVTIMRKAVTQHENRRTTSYLVQEMTVPSPAYDTAGTSVFNTILVDDKWSNEINIGFNFCFFGNTYSKIVLSENGCISFNTAYANTVCFFTTNGGGIITAQNIYNSILGPFSDMIIGPANGRINYRLEGTAPNRRFVISYNKLMLYRCFTSIVTSQIILHEAYNIIDVIIIDKPVCSTQNGGRSIIGIQNSNGSSYFTAPGWNPDTTARSNVCYRFIPNGQLIQSISWKNSNGIIVSNTDTLTQTICPNTSNTYIANIINTCCNGINVSVSDTVTFKVDSLPTVTINSPSICSGASAILTVSGADTYAWSNGLGVGNPKTTPILTTNTVYTVTGTNMTTGCQNTAIANVTIKPSPVVAVNSPTICVGDSVKLTASGANTYSWSNGSTDSVITVNPISSATYTVTGTLNGCTGTAVSTVTVNTPTAIGVSIAASSNSVCAGTNIIFTAIPNTTGLLPTYQWYLNNTPVGTNSANYSNATLNNNDQVRVIMTGNAGCITGNPVTSNVITINVAQPTSTISQSICQGQSITIGGQVFNTPQANRIITLTGGSSQGCDSIIILNLTVNPIIAPSVNISSINNNICPDDTIKLIASSSVASSYQWYVNATPAGINSNQFSSSVLNNGDSIYVVATTVVSCTNPDTATSNTIVAKVNKINYTKSIAEYCLNDSFIIDTSNLRILTIPDPNYVIFWTNGAAQITDSVNYYTVHNIVSGQLPFTIRYGNNCAVNDELDVIVNPLPAIDAIVDLRRVKYEQEVQLDAISNVLLSYHWLPATLVSNDSIRNPSSIITSSTLFMVNVQDSNGCTNRDSVFVELINDCEENRIYLPTGFSPNRDGINDCFGVLSPPDDLSDYKLTIYDRWSEKVFETTDKDICWDGTYKGANVLADSYSYIVSFKCSNGTSIFKAGIINIIK